MDASRFDRLSRHLGDRASRRTALGGALAGVVAGAIPRAGITQQATPVPGATPSTSEQPVLLYVQTFASGRGEVNPGAGTPSVAGTPTPAGGASFLLTLEGHTGQTVYFSDRPNRIVGAMPTEPFFETLGFTPANPPNAALVAEFRTGQGVVLLELTEPILDAGTGTVVYGAEILQGYQGKTLVPVLSEDVAARLPAEFGPAALFIDSGAEAMVWATAAVSGAGLGITYTSYPPTQLEVCGFSAIPGAIGGNPDIGEYTGIASLYLGSAQFSQGVWITADCVTISPPPGVNAFPAGQYRLEITAPPDYRLIDFANFRL